MSTFLYDDDFKVPEIEDTLTEDDVAFVCDVGYIIYFKDFKDTYKILDSKVLEVKKLNELKRYL